MDETSQAPRDQAGDVPNAPMTVAETGQDMAFFVAHFAKGMYLDNLEDAAQFAEATKLPGKLVSDILQEMTTRKLVQVMGSSGVGAGGAARYQLTRDGQQAATDACNLNQYFGPAPVTLKEYQDRILLQGIRGERIGKEKIAQSFADIVVPESFTKRLGPAINSGHSILIYGPAGNGKTTVAEKVAAIFETVIYVPYCFEVDGAIIKVFDPALHKPVAPGADASKQPTLRRDRTDKRWVACRRPVVITGGELTLEMLDLNFNAIAKFYEAPMHVKALNGTFIIDDFGRQIVSPEALLNRWIVPLQSRKDYLTLHSGKSFSLPFDELVIFSTNLAPADLMDPAFLRRIPYKLETLEPSVEDFRAIFQGVAKKSGLALPDDIFGYVVAELRDNFKKPLACYQPKFIIDQVLAACKYEGIEPAFRQDFVADALANLYVTKSNYVGQVGTAPPK
ncbi:MAG: hypothetical protein IT565_11400 [Rhodospirillales bacterium]|nr:hypothetical protein [Rhodospirillales bacterium]